MKHNVDLISFTKMKALAQRGPKVIFVQSCMFSANPPCYNVVSIVLWYFGCHGTVNCDYPSENVCWLYMYVVGPQMVVGP